MASLVTDKHGRRRIRYFDAERVRKVIYLGTMPLKQSNQILTFVERLVVAQLTSYPIDEETARCVGGLCDKLRSRLAVLRLIPEAPSVLLVDHIDKYIRDHRAKDSTKTVWLRTRKHLLTHFHGRWFVRNVTRPTLGCRSPVQDK